MLTLLLGEPRARVHPGYHPGDPRLAAMLGIGVATQAGEDISEATAEHISAFFNGVELISNAVAMTPIHIYERLDENRKRPDRQHPAWRVLRRPNREMTAYRFRKLLQRWVLLWGNGFAEIERDQLGRPLALWPIHPSRVTIRRDSGTGQLFYEILADPTKDLHREPAQIDLGDMLHVRHASDDGIVGVSVIARARETLGLARAAELYGARFFGNSATPSVVLKTPRTLTEPAAQRLRESWKRVYGGDRQGGTAVLEEGMELEKLSMPNDDAQFMETRTFSVVEIARWLNLPPHKLKELTRATFSNIEHQAIETVTDSYMPWFVEWEEETAAKLLRSGEQDRLFVEYMVEGLLRGDTKSRYEAYAIGQQHGWLSVDEIRARENLNPLPDGQGELYLLPVNMTTAKQMQAQHESDTAVPDDSTPPATPPAPPVEGDPESDDEEEQQRQAAVRGVLVDAFGRLVRKECKAIENALKRGEDLATWHAVWLETFAREVREVLRPGLQLAGADDEAVAARYVAESRGQVAGVLRDAGVDGLGARLTDWRAARPAELAGRVLGSE